MLLHDTSFYAFALPALLIPAMSKESAFPQPPRMPPLMGFWSILSLFVQLHHA